MFPLNNDNYYSTGANLEYMSVSQFKDFAGTYGKLGCEACALAKIKGEWQEEKTTPLLVGGYVDAYFEGTIGEYAANNPEIFTKGSANRAPELKAPYRQAELIIEYSKEPRNKKWNDYMSGEKQIIMTGELFGATWKIKMDSYIPGVCITDLKVIQSIYEVKWAKDAGYVDFIKLWNYDIQGAIYQKVVELNTGKKLPFYIAAVTKSDHPQFRVIHIPQIWLDDALSIVEYNLSRILRIKAGEAEPDRCERCNYCNDTYVIESPISATDLVGDIG